MRLLGRVALVSILTCGCASAPPKHQPDSAVVIGEADARALVVEAPSPTAELHTIDFKRRSIVGSKWRAALDKHETKNTVTMVNGKSSPAKVEDVTSRLVVRGRTDEVNPSGRAVREQLQIEQFLTKGSSGWNELLPAGSVVQVQRSYEEGAGAVTLLDGKLSEETAKLLGDMVGVKMPKGTDDEIMGTDEKQPIGGKWPINEMRFRESIPVEFGGVEGMVQLVGRKRVKGVDCLEIHMALRADIVGVGDMPSMFTQQTGQLVMQGSAFYPRDSQLPTMHSASTTSITLQAKGSSNGRNVVFQYESVEERREEREMLP